MKIGDIIKNIRVSKGYSRTQLACAVGVSYDQIRQWEIGYRNPGIKYLIRISNFLDISLHDLLSPNYIPEEKDICQK